MTKEQLQIDQELSLEQKILKSKELIKSYYEEHNGAMSVAYSGGKDSRVVLHLVRSLYPDIIGVFCNTTNEKKEILEYVKNTPNIKTLLPKKGFIRVMKEDGFPMISKRVCKQINALKYPTDNNATIRNLYLTGFTALGRYLPKERVAKKWRFLENEPFEVTAKCCEVLKHEPARRFEKESGLVPITGLMAVESSQRESHIIKNGYMLKNTLRAIGFWTEKDIWDYAKLNNIRFAENYYDRWIDGIFVKGDKRSGCEYCLMGYAFETTKKRRADKEYQNRLQISKICDPKRYEKMMKVVNNGITFKEAILKTFTIKEDEI
jgi:3'-phosphoadenosine 5'-phosphosulfate sulfotransferase (PAPS reductase)/FAD synthetase